MPSPQDLTATKLALYGTGLVVGGIGLAIFVGAVGAELLWKYIDQRR